MSKKCNGKLEITIITLRLSQYKKKHLGILEAGSIKRNEMKENQVNNET